jgi:Astacin (Peptidase family M12A)
MQNDKNGYMYLGDMMLSNKQYESLFSNTMKRHGLTQEFKHWPNATVPVKFSDGFNPELKKKAIEAMKYIMNVSCVIFDWKHEPKSDYVLIVGGKRCSSMVSLTLHHVLLCCSAPTYI